MGFKNKIIRVLFLTVLGGIFATSAQAASFYISLADGSNPNSTGVAIDLYLKNSEPFYAFTTYAWEVTAVGDIALTGWTPNEGSPAWKQFPEKISGTQGEFAITPGPIHIGTFTVDVGTEPHELWASSNLQDVVEYKGFITSRIEPMLLYSSSQPGVLNPIPEPGSALLFLLGLGLVNLADRRKRTQNRE